MTLDEDTRDLRRLYAGLAMMGDWATSADEPMGRWVSSSRDDALRDRARLYWRMADAMLATEGERS